MIETYKKLMPLSTEGRLLCMHTHEKSSTHKVEGSSESEVPGAPEFYAVK